MAIPQLNLSAWLFGRVLIDDVKQLMSIMTSSSICRRLHHILEPLVSDSSGKFLLGTFQCLKSSSVVPGLHKFGYCAKANDAHASPVFPLAENGRQSQLPGGPGSNCLSRWECV